MSRLIKMTPEYMDECRAEFEKALSLAKLSDGKLNYTKVFSGRLLYRHCLGKNGSSYQGVR